MQNLEIRRISSFIVMKYILRKCLVFQDFSIICSSTVSNLATIKNSFEKKYSIYWVDKLPILRIHLHVWAFVKLTVTPSVTLSKKKPQIQMFLYIWWKWFKQRKKKQKRTWFWQNFGFPFWSNNTKFSLWEKLLNMLGRAEFLIEYSNLVILT